MGQLEKYGLYVLCLVIFLILGVAMWGGGDEPLRQGQYEDPARASIDDARAAALRGETGGDLGANSNLAHAGSVTDLLGLGDAGANGPRGTKPEVKGGAAKPDVSKTEVAKREPVPPQVAPPAAARPQHKVVAGDTFESIARGLGSVTLVDEIKRLNPRVDPKRMQLNTLLLLPTAIEIEQLRASAAKVANGATPKVGAEPAASARSYTIKQGDTLEGIARRELGSHRRVADLQAANPKLDPMNLKIGRRIVLPAK